MSVIKQNTIYDGLIEIDGNLACEGCKTINPECRCDMHMDCTDCFIYNYSCIKCGHRITTTTKRVGKVAMYW